MIFKTISKIVIVLPLILLSFTIKSYAQDSTLVLTLDKAVEIALKNNRDIQLAHKDVERADAQIKEAYSNVWPSIDANMNYTRNFKPAVLFLPPGTPFNPSTSPQTITLGADNSYVFSATLNQTIFSFKVNTAIKIAQDYYDYFKAAGLNTEEQVIFQVKQAFYTVLLSRELINVSQTAYDVAKVNYENVQSQYKQGTSSEYDMLRAEVQFSNIKPMITQAKNNYELAKNNLKNLLAIDLNKQIEISGKFELEPVDQELLKNSNEVLRENNPLLNSLKFQSSVLEKNISLERSGYYPSLSAVVDYQWQSQSNDFKFSNYFWANTITLGFNLAIPIFDGFSKSARIEQATIDKEKLDITRQQTEEGLQLQVTQSQLKMNEARERVTAQEKSLEQAKRAVEIAQTRYRNGLGTQLEILDTQSSLTQTQTNYSQAIYDYLIAKAQWEQIIGISKK